MHRTSQLEELELYGHNPIGVESETDGGDESSFHTRNSGPNKGCLTRSNQARNDLTEFPGRNRAILMKHFEETGVQASRWAPYGCIHRSSTSPSTSSLLR